MRNAPAVSYPVGRSSFQAWLILGMVLCAAAVGLLWQQQTGPVAWRWHLFVVTSLLTFAFAAVLWWRTPKGCLMWDGQNWCWTCPGMSMAGTLAVHLDFQGLMVLSLRTGGRAPLWLWPQRSAQPELWQALRCAAFARAEQRRAIQTGPDADLLSR
ncbi:hypothetical protein [Rhodoferax sp.]|uniref:hypothetical protein n=1 Tax=Rhodoferax sp. TaxID=50421 RepID=UPI001ECBA200|nr:hypothetical protein [Rhodoferax sp.]MBT9506298.1 hypothetical protein [Rhodoferax sp.]